jgi:hypothetical protein
MTLLENISLSSYKEGKGSKIHNDHAIILRNYTEIEECQFIIGPCIPLNIRKQIQLKLKLPSIQLKCLCILYDTSRKDFMCVLNLYFK